MTAKEKANELLDKMYFSRRFKDGEDYIAQSHWIHSKQCALIAVDEIIDVIQFMAESDNGLPYWQEVRKEILAL